MLPQYYTIIIKNYELCKVSKIDEDEYNYFMNTFESIYHNQKGETFKMHENIDGNIYMLIVDDDRLYELLDDLRDEGFCDTIEFSFIDDYFNGDYKQYGQAF